MRAFGPAATPHPSALLLAALVAVATPAWSQDFPVEGTSDVGAGASPQGFGASTSVGSGSALRAGADAVGLVELAEPAARAPLTLLQVLDAVVRDAADAQSAVERVIQQEAALRRAWSALLPTLTAGASYSLTCLGGGELGVSCADRTASFIDPDAAERQAQLFEGLASAIEIGAQVEPDPADQQELLDQAAELRASASQIRADAADAKPVVVQAANVLTGSLTLAVPIFNGRAFPLLQNAVAAVDVAKGSGDQVRAALRYSATRAYYAAVTAKKLVALAEQRVASAARHQQATAARVESATQAPLALRRAELDHLRARRELAQARAGHDGAVAALGLVLGRREAFDVVEPGAQPPLPAGNADALIERALAARADVAAQRLAVEIAGRGEVDAWMMFLPSVNLVAAARGTSFTTGFVGDPVIGTVSVSAQLPLYDGGVRYAALKDSASRVREAKIALRALEDRVHAQVRGNLRDVREREAALQLSREAAQVAALAHQQAQATFDAGLGTALDVSDTALAEFLADLELARAELDLALAREGLRYVVGELQRPSSAN
ncbi:MAG: TolC family protein [Deltaproteobacteria bacterium]|nr:TolC family protein [Deltaproteobacteria bacterium]